MDRHVFAVLHRLEDDVFDNGPNDSYDEVSQREAGKGSEGPTHTRFALALHAGAFASCQATEHIQMVASSTS